MKADLVNVTISGKRYDVLNIVESCARYAKRFIASDNSDDVMIKLLETELMYKLGAPKKRLLDFFLLAHDINLISCADRKESNNLLQNSRSTLNACAA